VKALTAVRTEPVAVTECRGESMVVYLTRFVEVKALAAVRAESLATAERRGERSTVKSRGLVVCAQRPVIQESDQQKGHELARSRHRVP